MERVCKGFGNLQKSREGESVSNSEGGGGGGGGG